MIESLETIHSDDDWLDLREGERAHVIGRLDGPLKVGASSLVVSLADWSLLAIDLIDAEGAPTRIEDGQKLVITVSTTENGLQAQFSEIAVEQAAI